MIIGLTGTRGVGKSEFAKCLVEQHGFQKVHPFAGGKVATRAYFHHLGIDADTAFRMTDLDLKEQPCDLLPGRATPRFFMEKFGNFMATTLGTEWTLGAEIDRALRHQPEIPLVAESVVYEADMIRSKGGVIIKITRNQSKALAIDAPETDPYVAAIVPDIAFENNFDKLGDLAKAVKDLLHQVGASAAAVPSFQQLP